MTTITQLTHNILLRTGLDVAVPAMLLNKSISSLYLYDKVIRNWTALRCVCVCFFLLCIKTCIKYCLALPNNYSLRPSSQAGALLRRGGKRKERLQLRLWNLNICMAKVDEKCWLADMTLIMASLPLAFFFVCFYFSLIGGNLTAHSTGSHRGIGGGIQIPDM